MQHPPSSSRTPSLKTARRERIVIRFGFALAAVMIALYLIEPRARVGDAASVGMALALIASVYSNDLPRTELYWARGISIALALLIVVLRTAFPA